ncbi:MAG: 4-(cytidine 5'-diphospho)-2-C-methyl-D-erythritol kinase, partial [bacterium]|nr:4-(cytidine 5'-diphospho)-2-C-methyl-D-erythritol kinase [bacterium]
MKACSIFAPAKINIALKVVGKRGDGYHELNTIFQTISLGDDITIRIGCIGIKIDGPPWLSAGPGNLAFKAADAFYRQIARPMETRISLHKRVPMQAGLGGGSSDAAAVLLGLNTLYGGVLAVEELSLVAKGIGSDVNYFLDGGTAFGYGRGEQIEILPELPSFWLRVVKPPFGLRTPEVFAAWQGN